ncbi:MAG: aminotransferase class IV [Pseudomonadales bacterium]
METSESWWINGEPGQQLPVDNRGLAYGDGLFETMRLIDKDIPLLNYHLTRLEKGASRLGLLLDRSKLDSFIARVIPATGSGQNVLKLICVRSGSARGYQSGASNVEILLRISPLKADSSPFEPVAEVCFTRLACQPALAGIKHLNRLEQVLAARELAADVKEGIFWIPITT